MNDRSARLSRDERFAASLPAVGCASSFLRHGTAPAWCNPARDGAIYLPKRHQPGDPRHGPSHQRYRPESHRRDRSGQIQFALHDWIGDSWAILFSTPRISRPVCTTEFGAVARLADEWEKRGTKVIGVSVDGVEEHVKWKADIEAGWRKPGLPDHRR
jgi:hypothetical protein